MQLPIEDVRGAFLTALGDHGRVVLTAPTGSGKSTQVPLWCTRFGRVLVVEPRRLACRSLAQWVARSRGEPPGETIGFSVRHQACYGPETQVVFATPGTVLRMLHDDGPFGFDVLIIDEFHERQVQVDLIAGLAVAKRLPHLVLMSATLRAETLAKWLDAAWIEGTGRSFEVTITHSARPALPTRRELEERTCQAVRDAADRYEGDILVFLPGKAEIFACQRLLSSQVQWEVCPLHGGSNQQEQDKVFRTEGPRRIVLATNVAETSVTLPRVGVVIDSGLVRQTRYHHGRSVLRLVPIAQDSADQRAGRAGRVGPGHCVRLWSQAGRLEVVTRPEILRSDLTDAALAVELTGHQLAALPLPTAPEPYMIEAARENLRRLGCVNEEGITPVGRAVGTKPLDAYLARFLVAAAEEQDPMLQDDAIALVAGLSAPRDIVLAVRTPSDQRTQWEAQGCEATRLIRAVYEGVPGRDGLHEHSLKEARRIVKQLGGAMHRGRTPGRLALAKAALAADPASAYVRRRRGRGFGRPGQSIETARDSILPMQAEAIIAYNLHTSQSHGTSVCHTTTCASPIPLQMLRKSPLRSTSIQRAWNDAGTLMCTVQSSYVGITLSKETLCPDATLSPVALLWALDAGTVFAKAVQTTRDRATLYNLFRRFQHRQDLPAIAAREWLEARVMSLGMESGHDLALLSPSDFTLPWPAGFDEAARHEMSRRFPMSVDVGDAAYRCLYDTARRVVTLEITRGTTKKPPPLQYLPRWDGWGIELRRASNVRVLR